MTRALVIMKAGDPDIAGAIEAGMRTARTSSVEAGERSFDCAQDDRERGNRGTGEDPSAALRMTEEPGERGTGEDPSTALRYAQDDRGALRSAQDDREALRCAQEDRGAQKIAKDDEKVVIRTVMDEIKRQRRVRQLVRVAVGNTNTPEDYVLMTTKARAEYGARRAEPGPIGKAARWMLGIYGLLCWGIAEAYRRQDAVLGRRA